MIGLLHGYLLEGSGSNLWTRAIVRALCRQGETVHLVCQENHPERYDFIAEAIRYSADRSAETWLEHDVEYAGRCIMHKPTLGNTLPVYVLDRYEEFERVVPMVELPDNEIEAYIERNVDVVRRIVRERGLSALHANHAVLMSVVAQRVAATENVPFTIMPHGSAIEYAVKADARFHTLAVDAFNAADGIFVIGKEMRGRVRDVFGDQSGLEDKMSELNLGVDTSLFATVEPAERPAAVQRLKSALEDIQAGRTAAQQRALQSALSGDEGRAAFRRAIAPDVDYALKSPDGDAAEKLDAVDWSRDPVVLFVGRLIANKGIQSLLAAWPSILAARPDARLVVVGHGPLREPLEGLLWALGNGERALARRIVEWGTSLEDGEDTPFASVAAFLSRLEGRGELDTYFESAERHVSPDNVIFTGYLTHKELCHLFPCADVAVFPSVIREAGPLVFLEALASGCFPVGTYFGGMAVSIDAAASALPAGHADHMKLSPEPDDVVDDIVTNVAAALSVGRDHSAALRQLAIDRYDWVNVARVFSGRLAELSGTSLRAAPGGGTR